MKRKTWKILAAVPILGILLSTGALADSPPKMPYVFGMYCYMCHQQKVQIGPVGILDMKSKEGNDLNSEYIRNNVRFGYNAMPAFRLSEVSAKQLDDIVSYLKELAKYRKVHPSYQPTVRSVSSKGGEGK
jgi:mono/diheme cytochrome c family protein